MSKWRGEKTSGKTWDRQNLVSRTHRSEALRRLVTSSEPGRGLELICVLQLPSCVVSGGGQATAWKGSAGIATSRPCPYLPPGLNLCRKGPQVKWGWARPGPWACWWQLWLWGQTSSLFAVTGSIWPEGFRKQLSLGDLVAAAPASQLGLCTSHTTFPS